ncbi:hypothetical protein TNCV_4582711 [Trichonephila clavipes]|nr:hypothetical protein TNCV_4582711 [Trichonephila clavipes]
MLPRPARSPRSVYNGAHLLVDRILLHVLCGHDSPIPPNIIEWVPRSDLTVEQAFNLCDHPASFSSIVYPFSVGDICLRNHLGVFGTIHADRCNLIRIEDMYQSSETPSVS